MNWATELAAFDPSPELVEWVRERVAKLADESAQALRWRDLKIDKLTLELAHPRPMRFGASSEAFAAAHRDLFDETLAVDIAACEAEREAAAMGPHRPAPARPPRERAGRQPLPAHLERVEHRHEPALRPRTACGTEMVKIGEDVSEKLSVVPARFFVERHVYPKYVCRPCETIVTAPAPAALIDGGLAAPALLAWVMVGKYVDHLPLYRLEQQAAREGVILSRSTLAEWVGRIGVALEPLGARLSERLLQDAVLHADETPVAQLDPGRGQTKRAYLWAYRNNALGPAPPIVVLDYQGGRGGEHARQFLQGWSGALMVDDYAGDVAAEDMWSSAVALAKPPRYAPHRGSHNFHPSHTPIAAA